jgi:hypothetical protein
MIKKISFNFIILRKDNKHKQAVLSQILKDNTYQLLFINNLKKRARTCIQLI